MKKKLVFFLLFSFLLLIANSAFSMGEAPTEPSKKPAEINKSIDVTPKAIEKKEITVYITKTGSKYHRYGCRYLSRTCIPITLKKAREYGYTPCSVCW
ncbi:MAG: hypothetical protein KKB81_01580 [Candidatus Margulisbacteria bacterium]|nr:hypothetical protein [Candidatus Margulisiibacteriota bacterium]MBU1021606.1 hypothetical protein [Candidatus Margulisiibacteriota bacterium]MBU1728757.1 hypothetical protein [Candidatus Margulisiibacteriota bacterium]MBU1955723.1 hypothetical protein [Candidatus Margulisiibacteriota bacterium]